MTASTSIQEPTMDGLPPPSRRAPAGSAGEGTVDDVTAGASVIVRDDEPVIALGSTLGTYKIVGVLGEGGMGRVFVAEHTVIGRRVALKVLRAAQAQNKLSIERFFTEARVVNRIKHPGIVEVTDLFVENGMPCIVMELLEGRTLAEEILDKGSVAVDVVVEIGIQVARVLDAAHAHDVVHRDLKPENIILIGGSPTGPADVRVKVLDFGVAKLGDAPAFGSSGGLSGSSTGVGASSRTAAGSIVGTPEYMAPEQLATKPVDARADIYALGIVLYEALAGQRPFSGGFGDLVIKHMTVEPPRLVEVPAGLALLVREMLAKDPQDRPQTMADVARALSALPRGDVDARPRGVPAAPPRRRTWIAAVGAGAALVIAGAVALWPRAPDATSTSDAVVVPTAATTATTAAGAPSDATKTTTAPTPTTPTPTPTPTTTPTTMPTTTMPVAPATRLRPSAPVTAPSAPTTTPPTTPPTTTAAPTTPETPPAPAEPKPKHKRSVIDPFATGGE